MEDKLKGNSEEIFQLFLAYPLSVLVLFRLLVQKWLKATTFRHLSERTWNNIDFFGHFLGKIKEKHPKYSKMSKFIPKLDQRNLLASNVCQ
jgi:hypothetical protein